MRKFLIISLFLVGCTTQAPVSQAPVYNITYTDNSQVVVGDNNTPAQSANTSANQSAEPNTSATASNTESGMWKYWLIITLVGAAVIYFYRKKIFSWLK